MCCRVLAHRNCSLTDNIPGETITIGEALMAPTVIYVKQVIFSLHLLNTILMDGYSLSCLRCLFFCVKVLDLISKGGVKGIAHITGGGFTDNIPRIFPKGLGAAINIDSWPVLPVFKWLQEVRVKCFHCLIEISICRFLVVAFHAWK